MDAYNFFKRILKHIFNGFLNTEVYVYNLHVFIDKDKQNHILKLTKVLYGLMQALRA